MDNQVATPSHELTIVSTFVEKRVLITGAAGFLGSHLSDNFLALGANVVGVDSLLTGRKQNLHKAITNSHFQFIEADVVAPPESYLPTGWVPDLILHFASPASPPKYQAEPVKTYLVNSYATHLLLDFLRTHNPTARFLFASTSEVYGDPIVHPQAESYWGNVNPNGIRSCYDEAKRMGETVCGVFARHYGMDVRIVRIFNTYGPRMDLADGRVIPSFLTSALRGEPLRVFGDGTQTRSYCFVDDLVAGLVSYASQSGLAGQTINLGNPTEFTVLETARIILRFFELDRSLITFEPLPGDDPKQRKPEISRARELLKWEPTVELEAGLRQMIASL